MNQKSAFHILTVGWDRTLIVNLCDRIEAKGAVRFSHLVHPRFTQREWPERPQRPDIYFFRQDLKQRMPAPDHQLLASLERDGIPTIHEMILGDRILSKLRYEVALGYATFLAQRMFELFQKLEPTVIVGGFDAIHAGIALAVAKRMNIPWFVLNFSVLPAGLACFCDRMSLGARVHADSRPFSELQSLAERSLEQFEGRKIQAPAYIAPAPLSLVGKIATLPRRAVSLYRTILNSRLREFLQFTEDRTSYSVSAAISHFYRVARAREAINKVQVISEPPNSPYVLFGLHMQPESSIDVLGSFFSNQMWVIELLSRSIPPSHRLLVKVHKSDISNYSLQQLKKMQSFPGVQLVAPFANTLQFIRNADLVTAIQGTMGLEAALLGKPVIMLGDSPVTIFPSASRIGEITDLPGLIRTKLAEAPPGRGAIVDAYASYLAPLLPATHNDWTARPTDVQIDGYVKLFEMLRRMLNHKQTQIQGARQGESRQNSRLRSDC